MYDPGQVRKKPSEHWKLRFIRKEEKESEIQEIEDS